jgi:predicted metal-dependent phosphoesterase TrpH
MALGFRIYQKALLSAKPDAVETLNASVPFESDNLRSIELAKRLGLPQTGGSDSHSADTVGDAYTLVEAEDKTIEAVVRAIREGNVKPAGCRSKPRMRVLRIFSAVIREVLRRLGVFFP